MLKDTNFLLFMVLSMVIAGLMQFYFLGTAQFMQDSGIPGKSVPAAMAVAQACQAAATFFALGFFLSEVGFKWTLVIGAACWAVMYGIYLVGQPKALLVVCQGLHGLAYVFFIIVGQIFAENMAKEEIRSSMQALIFFMTVGVGLFLGTQFAGIVMDRFSEEGKFQWRRVWLVPLVIMVLGVLLLAFVFNYQQPAAQ
jgi:MFS family permease